ncbi:MAG: hypothetical protein WC812_00710 [Candidatus Pacearchaeota archaeon]|jgi:hypothetical protein
MQKTSLINTNFLKINEFYGAFNNLRFKELSEENSKIIIEKIWDENSLKILNSGRNYLLFEFLLKQYEKIREKNIPKNIKANNIAVRYIITRRIPFGCFWKEFYRIDLSNSLIFPMNGKTLNEKISLGPKLPELDKSILPKGYKIYSEKERDEKIIQLLSKGLLDEKIFKKYTKGFD